MSLEVGKTRIDQLCRKLCGGDWHAFDTLLPIVDRATALNGDARHTLDRRIWNDMDTELQDLLESLGWSVVNDYVAIHVGDPPVR